MKPAGDPGDDDERVDLRPRATTWLLDRLATPRPAWLTRFLILRLLGLVYLCAFLGHARQFAPLYGERGLTPAPAFFAWLDASGRGFFDAPSVFWLAASDAALALVAWLGVALSLALLAGFANAITLGLLWAFSLSFAYAGQMWTGYGWDILLPECGFLAIFLAPPLDPRPLARTPPPAPVVWLYRWLAFRIMIGAGLIKLRGDPCWRELTCLTTHYETQPLPNPLSPFLHAAPAWLHQAGVLYNHFVELVVPFGVFGPRAVRHVAGLLLLSLQVLLILSGNLSFLNWLTIVPILACFDDDLCARVLPRRLGAAARRARAAPRENRPHRIAAWVLLALVALLSVPVVANLFSRHQKMNATFEPFALVNTYGAFGSMNDARYELIIEGSDDGVTWRAYELPCKPGDPDRRPCVVSPYHYRLDWQMWFAAPRTPDEHPWVALVVHHLLCGDRALSGLFSHDPFPRAPPRLIRVERYRYRFAPPGARGWWRRERVDAWLPPLARDDPSLAEFLRLHGLL